MVTMRIIFTAGDHERIHEATAAVEARSGAKIATVIVRHSGRYTAYAMAWAAFGAIFVAALTAAFRPATSAHSVIFVELWGVVALLLLLEIAPLRVATVPKRTRRANARNLAHREFAAHLSGDDANPKRILIFVSLYERYVEVIADHGTHALVPQESWDRIVDELIGKISSGRIADGVVSAIEACGASLPAKTETATGEPAAPASR
jgi:putative membrane protein